MSRPRLHQDRDKGKGKGEDSIIIIINAGAMMGSEAGAEGISAEEGGDTAEGDDRTCTPTMACS
jgi:hypothetical protein